MASMEASMRPGASMSQSMLHISANAGGPYAGSQAASVRQARSMGNLVQASGSSTKRAPMPVPASHDAAAGAQPSLLPTIPAGHSRSCSASRSNLYTILSGEAEGDSDGKESTPTSGVASAPPSGRASSGASDISLATFGDASRRNLPSPTSSRPAPQPPAPMDLL